MVKEKTIEKRIRLLIESMGGMVLKLDPSNFIGIPDRLALLPGPRMIFIEVKRPGNDTTTVQDEVIGELRDLGFEVIKAFNSKEVEEYLKNAQKGLKLKRPRRSI